MAQINLDIRLARDGKAKEFVSYLDDLRSHQSDIEICRSLFDAVDHEYLPSIIFGIFLSWTKSLDTIALCIYEGPGLFVRKQGIKHFGKALAVAEQWESAWRALGGTKGLVDLYARISVTEIKSFVRAISGCNRGRQKIRAREMAIEELLRALLPEHYRESKIRSHDKRPIQDHFVQMVAACSPDFVNELLDDKDQSNPLYRRIPVKRLIKTHGELLRKRIFKSVFGNRRLEEALHPYLDAFIYREPPTPTTDPQVSSSMAFATRVLKSRLANINNKRWPTRISEADIWLSIFERSHKRKLSEDRLHGVIMLGLQLLEANPTLKHAFQNRGLWSLLLTRWKKAPKLYEDSFISALSLRLGGTEESICRDFLETSRAFDASLDSRWSLLRLYCLHVPENGIDIDLDDDFNALGQQQWSSNIFYSLSQERAVQLLRGLHNANPEYNFLQGPSGTSILSNQSLQYQRNFNVVLLLTMLQCSSEESRKKAESAVNELRKKSATAREQLDRAAFAKAASDYAIASGSLDLYAETVTWQQRFVRDPLTVKVIFNRDAVATIEGIELLSGIPHPLPEDMTIAEVASRVATANGILMAFHETIDMAKREPSFHQPDWRGVTTLFGAAISKRVIGAKELQKRLQGQDADLYSTFWSETLCMLKKVNVDFLNSAYQPIRDLITTLPPTVLAATANDMLETGNKNRKKQDRQPGDDILERLSYHVLLRLSKGERPELAQQLVLQTILDRPDASSWHRQLLSVSFLNSLSAKDAHEMLLAFATAIGEKLEEQSYVKVGEPQSHPSKPPQSLVKVTTVKYLAQLLDNAQFISAEAAVDVLVELFKAGTHRDIRLATLDSLLSLLNNMCSATDGSWRSNPLVEKILKAFDTVVPVLGSINERRPPRAEDWEEARKTGTLPDISDIVAGLPPLMSAVFTAPRQYPGLTNLQADFVARYFLPVLGLSIAEHRKWVTIFLAKHKANIDIDDLPPTPITPQVWNTLLASYPELIPHTVLDDFTKHIVITIAPPIALQEFNKSLRKDVGSSTNPEVQHWLSVYDQRINHYSSSDFSTLRSLLRRDWSRPSIHNGISPSKLIDLITAHAALFLDDYEKFTDVWNNFVDDIRPPSKMTYPRETEDGIRSRVSTWQKGDKLVLEKLIELVQEKRNGHEQANNHTILPTTTKFQLWLLPYPYFPTSSELDSQCLAFSKELVKVLDSFLQGKTNVLRWPKIAEDALTVSKLLNTDQERLCVAVHIGGLVRSSDVKDTQRVSALNLVRVALAMNLIDDSRPGVRKNSKGVVPEYAKDLIARLKMRIEEWQIDSDEAIREKVADWKREEKDLWKILMSGE